MAGKILKSFFKKQHLPKCQESGSVLCDWSKKNSKLKAAFLDQSQIIQTGWIYAIGPVK